jgi:hypothetical protein
MRHNSIPPSAKLGLSTATSMLLTNPAENERSRQKLRLG